MFGVPKRLRDKYKVWQEGGITPQFALEVTSKITHKKDQEIKPKIYQKLGIREYFHYDPSGDCLNPILQGMRLVNDRYEPITANNISFDTLWLYSEVLGLELRVTSGEFRFTVPPTEQFLNTHEEEQQTKLVAESAFQQSEEARLVSESALRSLISHLLNSGMKLEEVVKMSNLSISKVQRLLK